MTNSIGDTYILCLTEEYSCMHGGGGGGVYEGWGGGGWGVVGI